MPLTLVLVTQSQTHTLTLHEGTSRHALQGELVVAARGDGVVEIPTSRAFGGSALVVQVIPRNLVGWAISDGSEPLDFSDLIP